MKSVKSSFIKEFGKHNAETLEACAEEHGNGINNKNKGSDSFKCAILIVIGYECISKKKYFKYHGFDSKTLSPYRFERWCKKSANLSTHDGDCDYISLMCGEYNKFISDGTKGKSC